MFDTEPDSHTRRTQLQRPEVVRVGVVVAIAIAALVGGVVLADLDHNVVAGLLRLVAAVVVILLGVWLLALTIVRRLRRIEAQLSDSIDVEHELYMRAYMDGLGGRS